LAFLMTVFFPRLAITFKQFFIFIFEAEMFQFCLFGLNFLVFAVYLETILIIYCYLILLQKIQLLKKCYRSLKFLIIFFFLSSAKFFLSQKTNWSYGSQRFWCWNRKVFYCIQNLIFFWNLGLYQFWHL
jgi:hypothetical protein